MLETQLWLLIFRNRCGISTYIYIESSMDSGAIMRFICWITLLIATLVNGINADKSSALCAKYEFWNTDGAVCVPCSTCKQYPKTPSCDTCPPTEPSDSWRVAAITSLSVLAAVIVFGALLIGVLVHQCRSRRTLREPIEETTGPLYPV